MAVPRFAPLVMVDGIIREVSDRDYTDRETGVVQDRGRKVILQTGRGFIEVVVGTDDARVPLVVETRWTVFCELSEWTLDNGRGGCTLKYADHVTRGHLKEIADSLPQPAEVKN